MADNDLPDNARTRVIDHGAPLALAAGTLLGRYRIDGVLGQGGFGITYRAVDTALNRSVAIKEYLPTDVAVRIDGSTVIPRSRSDAEDYDWGLHRFLDEAKTLARHEAVPNVVRVYDFVEANGTAYMVMALVEGDSLSALLRQRGTLDEDEILAILLPLLDGLEELHAAGVVHRDIKPSNIVLQPGRGPILIDFGAAREGLGRRSRSVTSILTPGYAPFEQYGSAGDQGPWTDIYALAATIYHAVAGRQPPDSVDRIRRDPMVPAIEAGAGRYSTTLLAAIDAALKVDERERPQNVAQWRGMLEADAPTRIVRRPTPATLASAPPDQRAVPLERPTVERPPASPATSPAEAVSPASTTPRPARKALIAAGIGAVLLAGGGAIAWQFVGEGGESAGRETAQPIAPQPAPAQLALPAKPETPPPAASREDQRLAELENRMAPATSDPSAPASVRDDARELAAEATRLRAELEARDRAEAEARQRLEEQAQRAAAAEAREAETRQRLEEEARRAAAAEAREAEARRAEEARRVEDARKAEEARKIEEARRAEEARKAEEARAIAARETAAREAAAREAAAREATAREAAAREAATKEAAAREAAAREAAQRRRAEDEARRAAQSQQAAAPAPAPAPVDPEAYVAQHWPAIRTSAEGFLRRRGDFNDPVTGFVVRYDAIVSYEIVRVVPAELVLNVRFSVINMARGGMSLQTQRLRFRNQPPGFAVIDGASGASSRETPPSGQIAAAAPVPQPAPQSAQQSAAAPAEDPDAYVARHWPVLRARVEADLKARGVVADSVSGVPMRFEAVHSYQLVRMTTATIVLRVSYTNVRAIPGGAGNAAGNQATVHETVTFRNQPPGFPVIDGARGASSRETPPSGQIAAAAPVPQPAPQSAQQSAAAPAEDPDAYVARHWPVLRARIEAELKARGVTAEPSSGVPMRFETVDGYDLVRMTTAAIVLRVSYTRVRAFPGGAISGNQVSRVETATFQNQAPDFVLLSLK